MAWHWQKRFQYKRAYLLMTVGQGFGFGFIYTTCNGSLWLGPLVIDFTIPTPLWWELVREEPKQQSNP